MITKKPIIKLSAKETRLGVETKAKKNKKPVVKSENFYFVSDAKSFQRKKRKEGYKTKLVKTQGIGSPFSTVFYTK